MRKNYKKENKILWDIVTNILWMAIRYAHGRHTYAPSVIRNAVDQLRKINPKFKLGKDITVTAPTRDFKGMCFRSDYLDDIFKIEEVK